MARQVQRLVREKSIGRLAALAHPRYQSMAFFKSGEIDALYSGLAMKIPWCAAIIFFSFTAFGGGPETTSWSAS
jgi:hypothetical protein